MYVIIQLCYGKSAGVKGDWMNFVFFIHNRKDFSESIVQSISFYNELNIENPVCENRSGDECLFKEVESIMTGEIKLPGNVLPDKAYQWNDNVWVVEDKPAVKVSKP